MSGVHLQNLDEDEEGVGHTYDTPKSAHHNHNDNHGHFETLEQLQKRKFHKIILGVIMTGAVIAAIILAILVSVSVDTVYKIDNVSEDFFDAWLEFHPDQATYLGVAEYNQDLPKRTESSYKNYMNKLQSIQDKLKSLDKSKWTETDEDTKDLLDYILDLDIEEYKWSANKYLVMSQLSGPQFDLPTLVENTLFETSQDFDDYIIRINKTGTYIDQIISLMSTGVSKGVTYPDCVLKRIPAQIEYLLTTNSSYTDSVFYAPFLELPENDTRRQSGLGVVQNTVMPAYSRLLNFTNSVLIPNANPNIAASKLPDNNGPEFYQWRIKYFTSTDMTADEIHELGLKEVERISAEMMAIVNEMNISEVDTVQKFNAWIRNQPQFYFEEEEDFLRYVRDICLRAQAALPALFKSMPYCPFGVEPIPENIAPDAPDAYYIQPDPECTRPGVFYVNTYDLEARPSYMYEGVALHETVPGHHLQIALQEELEGLPAFRTEILDGLNAYVEGWALYSESLGSSMGFYQDYSTMWGHLGDEIWRACRLVVDTGMHAKNWTRDEAVAYMLENTPMSQTDAEAEIDRYIAWPGQALGYKIGQLQISELKAEFEAELGEEFSIKEFHDSVLKRGALPMDMLKERVEADLTADETAEKRFFLF